jgi:hypothetical protein
VGVISHPPKKIYKNRKLGIDKFPGMPYNRYCQEGINLQEKGSKNNDEDDYGTGYGSG